MTVDEQLERAAVLLDSGPVSREVHALAGELAEAWDEEGVEWNEQTLRALVFGAGAMAAIAHMRGVCLCPEEVTTAAQALAAIRMLQPAKEPVNE